MENESLTNCNFEYHIEQNYPHPFDMNNNKLFCTFTPEDNLEEVLSSIKSKYKILYNKIFVLYSQTQDEYIVTYNIDLGNISSFLSNTILVHRKKSVNCLYTINGLNRLIESLNGGVLDLNYKIDWQDFQNSILITEGNELRKASTKLHRIIELN